jgi:hypothetical protein
VKVTVLPSARQDLIEGFAFYEKQQQGLGVYFLDSLFADIDSLTIHGGTHRRVFGNHRLLARTFPFAIYYEIESGIVRGQAVLDCRRNPAWIRKKIGGKS